MNTQTINHSNLISNNGIRNFESNEEKALDISVIRTRESRRIKRTNIDWFSI